MAYRQRVLTAVHRHEQLEIVYMDMKGDETERLIDPYQVIADGEAIRAWDYLRQDFRTFRIDRIQYAETTGVTFDVDREGIPMKLGEVFTKEQWEQRRITHPQSVAEAIVQQILGSNNVAGELVADDNENLSALRVRLTKAANKFGYKARYQRVYDEGGTVVEDRLFMELVPIPTFTKEEYQPTVEPEPEKVEEPAKQSAPKRAANGGGSKTKPIPPKGKAIAVAGKGRTSR